jgi:RNA polymerase sigma factor (sigma-70 family)
MPYARPVRPEGDITRLLLRWRAGEEAALSQLLPLVYQELRGMALRHLRAERSNHTLQRTALVHEAYLKLVDQRDVDWKGRAQFFSIASQAMRHILVDHARRKSAQKRGARQVPVSLDQVVSAEDNDALVRHGQGRNGPTSVDLDGDVDFEAIDAALRKLEALDREQGRLVELRFFGGLSIEETAEVVGTSPASVKREWALARAWLQRELEVPA